MIDTNGNSPGNPASNEPNWWERTKEYVAVLRPAWLAVVIAIAVSVLLQHPQAVDALNAVADKGLFNGRHIALFVCLLIFAWSTFYFPRALLYVEYSFTPDSGDEPSPEYERLRRWFPRILGTIPILSAVIAFARGIEILFAVFYLICAAVFLTFLYIRRTKLFLRYEETIFLHAKLPRKTYRSLRLQFSLATILFVVFLFAKVSGPQLVGPMGIVFLAASWWIAFGSMLLVYPSQYNRWPSLLFILLSLTAVFGIWNDNHSVQTLADEVSHAQRPRVVDHFKSWLTYRRSVIDGQASSYPVFIVAAEGGGIRAAYWTAAVLGALQEQNPDFVCHVFVISGVSGGSLGGAAFVAQAADNIDANRVSCDHLGDNSAEEFGTEHLDFLGQDFLSPALAGMLFPDLLQRFLPTRGAFALPDRAMYLESAWTAEWHGQSNHSNRFGENFLDLWKAPGLIYTAPSLFLNGTWVETGGRTVTSNLRLDPDRFVQNEDLLAFFDRPISLSTAVHMSARFTYVSPAGTIETSGETRHIVDGGYFENSGALTATELYLALEHYCSGDARCRENVRFVALIVSNNTSSPNAPRELDHEDYTLLPDGRCQRERSETLPVHVTSTDKILTFRETLSPIRTLFETRTARGYHAEDSLRAAISPCNTIRFQLKDTDGFKIPLGWVLSTQTQEKIWTQAQSAPGNGVVQDMLAD